ncbi:putative histone acetyltransferase type b catalytic subunit [Hypoxylon sp. FL0543]|nr:putative histone acetyltransferase type b catalytic subunit [Hypoxylon sp. FL0543]
MEDDWTVNANEAITIHLVRPGNDGISRIASFHPKFTYPIFGEDETIFGYKNLSIILQFDARDLRPNLSVKFSKKFKKVDDIEAIPIQDTMSKFLPDVAFQNLDNYSNALESLPSTWTPPGNLVRTRMKNGEIYEIWHGTLNMPDVFQLMKRIQILILFYIEGGSYIIEPEKALPDDSFNRWSLYVMYKKNVSPNAEESTYVFQGFATTYKFWMFEPKSVSASLDKQKASDWELPTGQSNEGMIHRLRISQFLILPPFQGRGIGAMLYDTIFDRAIKSPTTREVTVEDPNEDFDVLRDICDLKYLRKRVPEFARLKINTAVPIPPKKGVLRHTTHFSFWDGTQTKEPLIDTEMLEKIRVQKKIAPRQFWRLVEMHLMSKLPDSVRPRTDAEAKKPKARPEDTHVYNQWRLILKQRLYRRNVAVLGEFALEERIAKLNETVSNVEWDYARTLERLESKPTVSGDPAVSDGKRKLMDQMDKADEMDTDIPASKKARF